MSQNLEQVETTSLGNTITKPDEKKKKKQSVQSKRWVFTFNNYTIEDIEQIETVFKIKCKKYIFQKEIGQSGNHHLQGAIWTYERLRPTEMGLSKSIHWESMKGTDDDATNYCQKKDTAVGEIYKFGFPKPLKQIILRDWQIELFERIKLPADDRKVIWVYNESGNVGKSVFCKYCVMNLKSVCFVDGVKKADIINGIFEYQGDLGDDTVVLFDIPRNCGSKICYSAIESIKNGLIYNTKYETGSKIFNSPHIVIFSNEKPILDKTLSVDRWEIYEILGNKMILQVNPSN